MSYGIGKAPEERTVNGFFCMGCNSLLLSLYTHDYKVCECGNMVDGGNSYVRRGYKDEEAFRQVIEIYDWSGILVAAELGFTTQFSEYGEKDEQIQALIAQERLIYVGDAHIPEDGDQVLVQEQSEEELEAAEMAKEARDREAAAELFHKISLVGSDDPTLP